MRPADRSTEPHAWYESFDYDLRAWVTIWERIKRRLFNRG